MLPILFIILFSIHTKAEHLFDKTPPLIWFGMNRYVIAGITTYNLTLRVLSPCDWTPKVPRDLITLYGTEAVSSADWNNRHLSQLDSNDPRWSPAAAGRRQCFDL